MDAARRYEEAVLILRAVGSTNATLLADALQGEGYAARAVRNLKLARERLNEALAIYSGAAGARSVNHLATLSMLGEIENAAGNFAAALALLDDSVPDMEARLGATHTHTLAALRSRAFSQMRTGRFNESRASLAKLLGATEPYRAQEESYVQVLTALMSMYGGDFTNAEALMRKVLSKVPPATIDTSRLTRIHGEILLRANQLQAAGTVLSETERLQVSLLGDDHPDVAATRVFITCFLARMGDVAGARAIAQRAADVLRRERGEKHPGTLVATSYLSLLDQGDAEMSKAKRIGLAQRIDHELGWQDSAKVLARWLRSDSLPKNWGELPVAY